MNEISASEMERQLRILMNIAADQPPRRVSVEAVRARVTRRRTAQFLAAAAAVVLVGGVGVALAAQVTGPAPATGPVQAGPPPFYLQQSIAAAAASSGVVRSSATGEVTATFGCPWRGARVAISAIAPADNRTFFLVCQKAAAQGATTVITGSRIYRLNLTRSGRAASYALVNGGDLPGFSVSGIAATPDGSELAVSGSTAVAATSPVEVIVINTKSGAHALWTGFAKVPGKVWYSVRGDISLTANGRELAFLVEPRCVKATAAPQCHVSGGEEVRAVSPADRGGQLSSSRLLMKQAWIMQLSVGYINHAVISPDGSKLTLAVVSGPARSQAQSSVSVQQVPTATGRHPRILYRMFTGNGFTYQFFSSDPSGRYLILDAGPARGALANGWIDQGRLVPLAPANGASVLYETW